MSGITGFSVFFRASRLQDEGCPRKETGAEREADMKNLMRTLTLSAAALAALAAAPMASANPWGHFPLPPTPHEMRGMWNARHGERHYGYHAKHAYPYGRYAYPHGRYRVYAGRRFYAYRPGPAYVYVRGYGWCTPPYAGAVWVPGHYGPRGLWIEAHFR
jgi:hypothetical protein